MRCDQCQYWDKEYTHTVENLTVGECTRAMPFWDASEWSEAVEEAHEKDTGRYICRALKPEYADRRFFAQDGSDYAAQVLTAPDFFSAYYTSQTQNQIWGASS